MSERQEKKRRYNRLREYIFDFEWWLSTEPPMIRIFKWHKWKCSRPICAKNATLAALAEKGAEQ